MTTILQFPDTSLSILASNLPDTSRTKFMIVVLVVSVIPLALIYYLSPMRLTGVLVAAIASIEKIYLEALETGSLSASDINTAVMLSTLQLKVSEIREASLRNSLSLRSILREFLNGHPFALLRCIREILKESELREDTLHPFTDRVRSVCLRRRRHSPDST
ncbi:hypothetical protein B0H13DRAFT_1870252 [Mycena leptocephala]|nr:hypothetical protein B0H13DRAFT_1870252 [Mycena leptocephala]